jgi:uncharacterized protein YfaS (alpha-2-macroglobulin family)
MPMLCLVLSLLMSVLPYAATVSSPDGYEALRKRAEASYEEKSFRIAHDLYEQAAKLDLPAEERRWVAFRLADTAWRSDAASPSPDATVREKAREALDRLLADSKDDHERLWAEAQESLGDAAKIADPYGYNRAGDANYLEALDWWAGSADLDLARERYLLIVWKMIRQQQYDGAVEDASNVPRQVLVNAVAIARTPRDRDRARYDLAAQFLRDGNAASVERAYELLDLVIADGRQSSWYDDALFAYASALARNGSVVMTEGTATLRQDYVRALELFRRLVKEFQKPETRYYDQAQAQIRDITAARVDVQAGSTFLPDSEQEVLLSWRNLARIDLTVAAVDLTKAEVRANTAWLNSLPVDSSRVLRQWTFETKDTGEYVPGVHRERISPRLPAGAYVISAEGTAGVRSRQLLLVTDANIVLQSIDDHVQAYVSSALTGEPLAGAEVRLFAEYDSKVSSYSAHSDANGLADFRTGGVSYNSVTVFASAANGRQAYASTQTYRQRSDEPQWRIYAFTDRPAYRPEETVQWKFIARTAEGEQWKTPAGGTLHYEIVNPRGETTVSADVKLNAFGSAWGELPLTAAMPLGQYTIRFRETPQSGYLGYANLFRLEEYKLPEYRVSVSTAEEKGQRALYRLGDTIEATVEASYYFGGAVANATVDVRVTSSPFIRYWHPWREYPWYYEDDVNAQRYGYGGGQEVLHQTLKTDANGRVTVRIETPRDGNDQVYSIDAVVTDASRRQVTGKGTVRVMKQRYAVDATAQHYVHRPREQASVDFHAADANDQPVQTEGTVTVVRHAWRNDAVLKTGGTSGTRIGATSGATIDGWQEEVILTAKVSTDAEGKATFTFTPPRNGYYIVRWTSGDSGGKGAALARDVVHAEAAIWVTDRNVDDVDYRAGSLTLIVDRETLHPGDRAAVLILTPASGRWVVVNTVANDILDTQVVHLDGTVKLLEVPVDERHSPNFFISATSVFDRVLVTQTQRVVVPPIEKFVKVEVKPDREQYEPKQKGTVTVTTRDAQGRPVAAEVALSVSDESVTAIGEDPAGDPRQFFFSDVRQQALRITASVQQQRYVRLVVDENGVLLDERQKNQRDQQKKLERREVDQFSDSAATNESVVGGVLGGAMKDVMPPPPPPMAARGEVSEAITVTASAPAMLESQDSTKVLSQAGNPATIEVRNDFRSTAFWKPDLVTGANGTAVATIDYPQALTTWRATARAVTVDSQFGMGTATATTNLPLLVRLQGPRFFVAGDRVTISGVVNNNSDAVMHVQPALEAEGLRIVAGEGKELDVPAHGEARADWTVVAEKPGSAKLRVTARGASHGDAMERTFTVYEHGIEKLLARSGKLRSDEATVRIELPAERRDARLTVQVAPSLAVTMLDALPYLIDFPYGCTEQTMSRFLPAAIVARTLTKNGLDAGDVEGRLFGGIEPSTAAATHATGRKDLRRLDAVTAASMKRLYDFQHSDGGWGWWKTGSSDEFMTAYVVWGFAVAKEGGLPVDAQAVERGVRWLDGELVKSENDPHGQTWMLHAIAAWRAANGRSAINTPEKKAFDRTYASREHLTAYSRALLALAAHDFGSTDRAKVLIRNLEDGVKLDRKPDESVLVSSTAGTSAAETMATAHWGADRFWWHWWEGPVETTSFALQALVAVDPENKLVEPVMNWLIKNRRGAQWSNTRDTAIALLALNDYLQASGELAGNVSYEVTVNGKSVATKSVLASEVLRAPSRFAVDAALLRDGANEIRIRRTAGTAPLYFAAEARFVSLEEPVKAAGNELFVRRDYVRLVPHPTLLKGVVYERVPLRDKETVASGERVEVVLTLETKNDYDYLLFEDLKPAGLEAVELQSGMNLFATELRESVVPKRLGAGDDPTRSRRQTSVEVTGRSVYVYQELRDRKVANFIDHLPQGIWEVRYALRAEVPGTFHALPLLGQAMYVPEIRANSDEVRISVSEREQQ